MNDFLWQTYHRLIAETTHPQHRFLFDKLDNQHRLTGIVGARGVGKTTLLLQYIKENLYHENNTFYFSADNIYFSETTLLSFIDELFRTQGITIFFIDEIHKYPNWNQELKNIYDSFPKVRVIFSGSSSIDLLEGSYDLSRRAKLLQMPGLSFREYLFIKTGSKFPSITFAELLENHQDLAAQLSQFTTIIKYFEEYQLFGYYPIVFENNDNLYEAISQVVDKTIYEDIANFYNLKTSNLLHFKRIIHFLASIPPGEIKTNNVAKHLGIDNKTADHYLHILQKSGILKMLYPVAHGNQLLTKPSKVYLDNVTLLAAINTVLSEELDIGTQRELVFLQLLNGANIKVYYPKKGDFLVDDVIFEVGGKNKTWQQLQSIQGRKILVKDNIIIGSKNEIPLYLFGFLY